MDLGELKNEKEFLSSSLRLKLRVNVTSRGDKVLVDSENLSTMELKRLVNKFVYNRNLMNKYWVALDGGTVTFNKFKRSGKHEKKKEKGTIPPTIKHGW